MNLSILISAYNVEAFIEKCVRSCYVPKLAESYEIIVVNDGSTDNTKKILEDLSISVPNLKVIHKENGGLGAARNTGIENGSGKYIWMIDGDDYLEPKILQNLLEELNQEALDVIAINYNVTDERGKVINTKYPKNHIQKTMTGSEYYAEHFQNSYTWQYIFRRELFVENELWFKERINMQDSEIFPKIMYYTRVIKYIDAIGYNYVQQENSFTNSQNPEKRYKYFESIVAVKNSLMDFAETIQSSDIILYGAIQNKIASLHQVVFNHLVFFKYDNVWFKKCLGLLKENGFYPLQYKPKGKMKLIKWGLNICPTLTKAAIDIIK